MLSKEDVRNLVVLVLGLLVVVVLVPPARPFPITDDWIYSQSVTDLLNCAYKPHDFSQATALTHVAWGTLFSLVLGQSFTVLAFANLVMSGACMLIFYLLLRQMQVTAGKTLFGTAVLACNPMYVYLSYSFMTDITFLTCMLAGCLCYVRGMEGYTLGEDRTGWWWLLAGSLAATLAYLTRQFGLLLLPAALGYLWWSRRWTWARAATIAAIPLAVCVVYLLWDRTHPVRLVDIYSNRSVQTAISDPLGYIVERIRLVVGVVPILGLSLLPIIRLPRRPLLLLPFVTLILLFQIRSLQATGSIVPQNGNIVDHTGFAMLYYIANITLTEAFWTGLGVLGAFVLSLYLTASGEGLYGWLRARPWRHRVEDPALLLYFLAALFVITSVVTLSFYDRYLLPILPLLIALGLRCSNFATTSGGTMRQSWRWVLSLLIALFAFTCQADYMAHAAARWNAAEQLVLKGARPEQVFAGFEWAGQYSYEKGAAYIRETQDYRNLSYPPLAILDPRFMVADWQYEGYTEIGAVPYSPG